MFIFYTKVHFKKKIKEVLNLVFDNMELQSKNMYIVKQHQFLVDDSLILALVNRG